MSVEVERLLLGNTYKQTHRHTIGGHDNDVRRQVSIHLHGYPPPPFPDKSLLHQRSFCVLVTISQVVKSPFAPHSYILRYLTTVCQRELSVFSTRISRSYRAKQIFQRRFIFTNIYLKSFRCSPIQRCRGNHRMCNNFGYHNVVSFRASVSLTMDAHDTNAREMSLPRTSSVASCVYRKYIIQRVTIRIWTSLL